MLEDAGGQFRHRAIAGTRSEINPGCFVVLSGNSYLRFYSRFYYGLRIYLHRKQWLLRLAHMLRGYAVLGPLRTVIIRYYKTLRANKPFTTDSTVVFPFLNVDETVDRINEFGYARVGNLQETYVGQIFEYCRVNKRTRY